MNLERSVNRLKFHNIKDEILNTIIDFVLVLDLSGRVVFANKSLLNYLGYKLEEIEGNIFLDCLHPEDLERTLKAFESVKSDGTLSMFINRYKHKNGEFKQIAWRQSTTINTLSFGIAQPHN